MDKRCISFKEARLIVPYSRAHYLRMETEEKYAALEFPKRVRLSQCRVCWYLHELLDWLAKRPRG